MLPDKPSALIRLALEDLRKVEAQSDIYEIAMSDYWHEPDHGFCCVCLAGAVIAGTLKADPEQEIIPSNYPPDMQYKLLALDTFRVGEVRESVRRVLRIDFGCPILLDSGPKTESDLLELDLKYSETMPNYDINPTEWKAAMIDMANDLEAIGL